MKERHINYKKYKTFMRIYEKLIQLKKNQFMEQFVEFLFLE